MVHYVNAFLWAVNAVLWFGYANSPLMGVVSLLAAGGSIAAAKLS